MRFQTLLPHLYLATWLSAVQAFSPGQHSWPQTRPVTGSDNKNNLFVSTLAQDAAGQYVPHGIEGFESYTAYDDVRFSSAVAVEEATQPSVPKFDYGSFAKEFPLINNMMIASTKAALADLFAQTVIVHSGLDMVNWERTLLFCLFGALYQGGFQYLYQVHVFKQLFDIEEFTSQPWMDKLRDGPGLKSLGIQVALDLAIMSSVYLPVYYTFKASIFSGVMDPSVWIHDGMATYGAHFGRDEADLLKVWLPADLVCFSAPLILRLPLRQIVSLFYTAYLSAATFSG